MLDWPGFLINSHDPLRGHVLKHIRQNSLTSLRYSVAEQGNEKQKRKFKNSIQNLMPRKRRISPKSTQGGLFQLNRKSYF